MGVELRGRTALITGASSGIGRALAHAFAREGYALILTARSEPALKRVESEVLKVAPSVRTVVLPADLRDPEALAALAQEARRLCPTIEILVNNAGVGLYAPSREAPADLVRHVIELNLLAPIELTRQLMPALPRGGAVVNISSIAGKVPLPWLTAYSASKFALNGFSDALRMETAEAGIHVLCVCPGYVDTPFRENVLAGTIPPKVAGQRRFLISADECAQAVLDGLRKGKRTVVTPRIGWLLVFLTRLLPGVVFDRMARMSPRPAKIAGSPS